MKLRTYRYTADGMFLVAQAYANSAAKLAQADHPTHPMSHLPAISMLAGFSFELALKAVVLAAGGAQGELKAIGHDLGKAYAAASSVGFAPRRAEAVQRALLSISAQHREHQFRYLPDVPKMQVAKPETLLPVLDDLVDDVADFVQAREPSGGRAKPQING